MLGKAMAPAALISCCELAAMPLMRLPVTRECDDEVQFSGLFRFNLGDGDEAAGLCTR